MLNIKQPPHPPICLLTCICLAFPQTDPNNRLGIQPIWLDPESVSRLCEALLGIPPASVPYLPTGQNSPLDLYQSRSKMASRYHPPDSPYHRRNPQVLVPIQTSLNFNSLTEILLSGFGTQSDSKCPLNPDNCELMILCQSAHLGSCMFRIIPQNIMEKIQQHQTISCHIINLQFHYEKKCYRSKQVKKFIQSLGETAENQISIDAIHSTLTISLVE